MKALGSAASKNGQIWYKSPSIVELLKGQSPAVDPLADKILSKCNNHQYQSSDKVRRFRGLIFVILVPLLLISPTAQRPRR